MLTLEQAKSYLRIDTDFEDDVIASLLLSAESLTMDVARLSPEEWDAIAAYETWDAVIPSIRGEAVSGNTILHARNLLTAGTCYALGYLNEHREKADLEELSLTLRGIVGSVREGVV